MSVKYPEAEVDLPYGENAFALLAAVQKGLRQVGVTKEEQDAFYAEATAGDYAELTATCESWVTCR